jgi:hypothetical protein
VEVADVSLEEGLLRALPCSHFMIIDVLEDVRTPVGEATKQHKSSSRPRRPHFDRIQKAVCDFLTWCLPTRIQKGICDFLNRRLPTLFLD